VPHAVPASLVSVACDYIAFEILKRMPLPIKEPRMKAYENAVSR
jgi:hypothetical protein